MRAAALVIVLYGPSLLRTKVVALDVQYSDAARGGMIVRGKGRKERRVYLHPVLYSCGRHGLTQVAKRWAAWREHRRASPTITKSGRIILRGVIEQAVRNILETRRRQTAIALVSPYDVRH